LAISKGRDVADVPEFNAPRKCFSHLISSVSFLMYLTFCFFLHLIPPGSSISLLSLVVDKLLCSKE